MRDEVPRFDRARSRFQTFPSQAVRKTGSRMSVSEKGWRRLGETFGRDRRDG